MTIHDEKPRHRRFGYHQTIQTQTLCCHWSIIEKNLGASYR